jgi:hypothetical protein
VLVLIWFGAEVFPGQQICVTSCVDLSGIPIWSQAIAVGILPVLLAIGGFKVRKTEGATLKKETTKTEMKENRQTEKQKN